MRRKTGLIVSAGVLAVMAGLYAWMELAKPFEKKAEAGAAGEPSPAPLLSVDSAKILKLSFYRGDTRFVIARDGDGFVLQEPKLAKPRLAPEAIKRAFEEAARIAPDALVYDPSTPQAAGTGGASSSTPSTPRDFGFAVDAGIVPRRGVTIETEGDAPLNLEFGDSSATGKLYVRQEGKIWAFSSWALASLNQDLIRFRKTTLPQIDPQKIQELRLAERGRKELHLVPLTEKDDHFFQASLKVVSPYREAMGVDQQDLSELLQKAMAYAVDDFVDQSLPSAVTGLDSPAMAVSMRDGEKTVELRLGAQAPDGRRYAQWVEDGTVFLIQESYFDDLTGYDPFALIQKLPMLVGIDTLDKLVISRPGKEDLNLTLKRTAVPGKDEQDTKYFKDSKEVEEKTFKTLYQTLIGIALDGVIPEGTSPTGAMEGSMTFLRNGGKRALKWSFKSLNADFYALIPEGTGQAEFAVAKDQVTKAFAAADNLEYAP